MNRFVPHLIAATAFVLATCQIGFAQVQILDGDGKQIMPNEIPAEKVDQPAIEQVPEANPQFFGGNGSSIIIRKSFSSVDENGDLKTENSGKAIVIGPDGKQQEFDLKDGENMELNLGGMRIDGLVPGPAIEQQTESFSLGLQSKLIPPALASQLNLETGLMVSHVPPGTPAATAGVQQYDVLLYADDKQLSKQADLSQAIQAAGEADASVSLTLIRGGKEMSVVAKPEKSLPGTVNPGQMNLDLMNQMPMLNLKIDANELLDDEFFKKEMFGNGIEAQMRQQMEAMQERMRQRFRQMQR